MPAKDDTGRDQSTEYKADNRVEQDASASAVYAANRDVAMEAGLRSSMANPQNEAHLAGGKHGDSMNAIGDNVRDAAAEREGGRPIGNYERDMVAQQGVESKYLNPTMQQDISQQQAVLQDTQSRDSGRAQDAAAGMMAASSAMPRDLDEHTKKSSQEGLLGDANPLTGKEAAKSPMGAALSQAREGGVMGALGKSGASMGGGASLFGDGGKGLAAPDTPGQEAFTAGKAQQSLPSARGR